MEIESCAFIGEIVAQNYVGGIWGNNISFAGEVYINNSNSNVDVIGSDFIGGLAGFIMQTNVNNSFATGKVEGKIHVGGFVGGVEDSTIKNAYAKVETLGCYTGGFVGFLYSGSIINAYAVGKNHGSFDGGGFVDSIGGVEANIVESFWDIQATGQNDSQGGIPATTEQLKNPDFYKSYNWDFENVWQIKPNEYPTFQYQN